ncbi:MAG: hypothetical protein JWN48_4601 [Myxococcaceae bacterium]|nr:hypothetical protein [Myxococcaceae bacterium]
MISANYGNLELAEEIHKDWFRFIGGMPAEVVFVENGSPLRGQTALYQGVKAGWITKLLSIRPGTFDIGKHQAFIAEVSALAMATRQHALLYHLDVLVSRRGHEDWLVDAQNKLRDPGVFAIGGSFNAPSKVAEHDADWYLSTKLSGNFALLPRDRYRDAWLHVAESFLRSGYREEHPFPEVARRRFMMEVGLEQLLQTRAWRTMVRRETRNWSILHTNLNGAELAAARERLLQQRGIAPFLNAGDEPVLATEGTKLTYFGQPEVSRTRQLRIVLGASPIGPLYRRILRRRDAPSVEETEPPTVRELAHQSGTWLDQLAVVLWVDDTRDLQARLQALYAALGGRPGQVVGLLPVAAEGADQAWEAHVNGATDKLLVSRSLPVGGGISLHTMVDHGVLAHAHCPEYLLCRASALDTLSEWLPSARTALVDSSRKQRVSFPHGGPLELAGAVVHRRADLIAELEGELHQAPMLGGVTTPAPAFADRSLARRAAQGAA